MAEQQPPRFAVHPMRVIFMARAPLRCPVALRGSESFRFRIRFRYRFSLFLQISREPPPKLADAGAWSLAMHEFITQACI
jgi:hypothetical protein